VKRIFDKGVAGSCLKHTLVLALVTLAACFFNAEVLMEKLVRETTGRFLPSIERDLAELEANNPILLKPGALATQYADRLSSTRAAWGYQVLERQLAAISDRYGFFGTYLIVRGDDGVVRFVLQDRDLNDPPLTDDPYLTASVEVHSAFDRHNPAIVGPIADEWGTWYTTLIPALDGDTITGVWMLSTSVGDERVGTDTRLIARQVFRGVQWALWLLLAALLIDYLWQVFAARDKGVQLGGPMRAIFPVRPARTALKYLLILLLVNFWAYAINAESLVRVFLERESAHIEPLLRHDLAELEGEHPLITDPGELLTRYAARLGDPKAAREYDDLSAEVTEIVERFKFFNAYLVVLGDDGVPRFVLNGFDMNEVPLADDPYPDAPPELYESLTTGATTFSGPYTDEWGTWFTVFVPVTNGGGEVTGTWNFDYDARTTGVTKTERTVYAGAATSVFYCAILYIALFYLDLTSQVFRKVRRGTKK
jgi:hypothetical protein